MCIGHPCREKQADDWCSIDSVSSVVNRPAIQWRMKDCNHCEVESGLRAPGDLTALSINRLVHLSFEDDRVDGCSTSSVSTQHRPAWPRVEKYPFYPERVAEAIPVAHHL